MSKELLYNFTEEEKKIITEKYLPDVNNKGYCYITYESLQTKNIEDNSFLDLYKKYKINPKTAFNKLRKSIFKVLLDSQKNLRTSDSCVYTPSNSFFVIKDVSGFLKALKVINKDAPQKQLFYRGQINFSWAVTPGIYRNGYIQYEKKFMDEMLRNFPSDFNYKTTFDILAKMQHYGLPTRLVDVTSNPLIALFFACYDEESDNYFEDGRVFIYAPDSDDVKYTDSDTVSIISNISKMNYDFDYDGFMNGTNKGKFEHAIRGEKPYFEEVFAPETVNNCVFVKGNKSNSRIIKQDGSFLIIGIKGNYKEMADIPQKYSLINKTENREIILLINRTSKKGILEELKNLGVHEGTVYPEIENMAKYIKNNIKDKV